MLSGILSTLVVAFAIYIYNTAVFSSLGNMAIYMSSAIAVPIMFLVYRYPYFYCDKIERLSSYERVIVKSGLAYGICLSVFNSFWACSILLWISFILIPAPGISSDD